MSLFHEHWPGSGGFKSVNALQLGIFFSLALSNLVIILRYLGAGHISIQGWLRSW